MNLCKVICIGCLVSLARSQSFLDYLEDVVGDNFFNTGYQQESEGRLYRSTLNQVKKDSSCQKSKTTYTSRKSAVVDVRFPKATVTQDDDYLCTGYRVPFSGQESYVVSFTPNASMSASHHMLVYGCDSLPTTEPYWKCAMGSVCGGSTSHTLYAWARNATSLKLPPDVGYRIGSATRIKYFVVQMHYAKRLPRGQYDCSGFSATVTLQPRKNFAGIFLLGAPYINIPPHSNASVKISCMNTVEANLHVFAFRTHAHSLSTVITGYRERNGFTTMIGKGNPQWPHAFFTRVGGAITLRKGDVLMAECDYSSNRDVTTRAGMGGSDEMCNFYMMYYTRDKYTANLDLECWGNDQHPTFPSSASDLAPYPGYAGEDSENAIRNGNATIPMIPDTHGHHHHHSGRKPTTTNAPTTVKQRQQVIPEELTGDLQWSNTASIRSLGQVGGVTVDSAGFVHVFHRGYRKWDSTSFDAANRFRNPYDPITVPTVYVYDPEEGKLLYEWGNGTFFMPHGISTDHEDNIWVTDVAMHQVFKFRYGGGGGDPLLTLGTRLIPGNDHSHFCKPTDVAIEKDGTIYVSDGYCNGRVVKFSSTGQYITSWGKRSSYEINPPPGEFNIAHNIELVQEERIVAVADRQNGRIQCFTKNGSFVKIIENKDITGPTLYAIAYSEVNGVLYAVNGPSYGKVRTSGFTINYETGKFIDSWEPSRTIDLTMPHDVAVSAQGNKVYVGQLNPHKVYQFDVRRLAEPDGDREQFLDLAVQRDDTPKKYNVPVQVEEAKYPLNQASLPDFDDANMESDLEAFDEIKRPAEDAQSAREGPAKTAEVAASPEQKAAVAEPQVSQSPDVKASEDELSVYQKKKKNTDARSATAIIVVTLVAIPSMLFAFGLCYVRSRTRRLKKYQDFLTEGNPGEAIEKKPFISPTGKLNLGKFFNKSDPEKQGFKRVKTGEDELGGSESEEEEEEERAEEQEQSAEKTSSGEVGSEYVAQEYRDQKDEE